MGIKIYFYAQLDNKRNEEKFLNKYEKLQKEDYIYKIEAREICSEFISRYFNKVEDGQDKQKDFEFKAFKDCIKVRENLLKRYQQIGFKVDGNINTANIAIYALLAI